MRTTDDTASLAKKYLSTYKKSIVWLAVVFIANIALMTLAPEMLGRFIDAAKSGGMFRQILWMILLYLTVILFQTAVSALLTYMSQSIGCRITDDYRRDVMAHYLKIDMEAHNRWRSGEIMTRLDEDVQGLYQYYYILYFKLVGSGLLLFSVLTVLAFRSSMLSAALFLISVLSILVFKWIQDRGIVKYVRRSKASAEFNGSMKEMIDNAVEIRAFDAEAYADSQLKSAMQKRFRESFPASLMYGNLWSASTLMQGMILASALAFGVYLWDGGRITLGIVYLIYTYTDLIIAPLQDFRNHMGELQNARAGMMRVKELMEIPSRIKQGDNILSGDSVSLEIRNLSFAYEGGDNVLRNINFCMNAGERLGIMGETGCGKSTLVSLIARLYEFKNGEILLNGTDIRTIDHSNLRETIAYCTQSVHLIHGTLRDNISLFDKRFSDGAIYEAIEKLNLTEWFSKFPHGLDTHLVMGENNLSAGEAQLIALIRLALKNPKLVLLDEITSRLDSATERRVATAIEALCRGKTVLAIAHKASAIAWMDRVMYMENGALFASPSGGYER